MQRKLLRMTFVLAVVLSSAWNTQAQSPKTPYPSMAPPDQYLMADRNAEIALARSAAPASISAAAEVLVMGRQGYETAVKGTNGFACLVERSWSAGIDDPGFWNPKIRGPICFNPAAVRSYVPLTLMKTKLVLAGKSKTEMVETIKTALDKKELMSQAPGAMCYMLSKEGYLGDGVGHWHPHLMFFVPLMAASTWGAGLPGSPVFAFEDAPDRMTVFMVPVTKWSDGTADANAAHHPSGRS